MPKETFNKIKKFFRKLLKTEKDRIYGPFPLKVKIIFQ